VEVSTETKTNLQSRAATSPPLQPLGTNSTKHNVVFDSGPLAPLCKNMTSSVKPEIHKVLIALSSDEDRAIGNMYRKFREVWTFVTSLFGTFQSRTIFPILTTNSMNTILTRKKSKGENVR